MIYPSFRGKIADFSLVYDQKAMPESPVWIETYHAYAPGAGSWPRRPGSHHRRQAG